MKNINNVTVSGNLVKDAYNGKVCTFTVACNEMRKEDDEWVEYPNYFDCVIFGKYGDTMAEYLKKGVKVCINGKLNQSRWVDDDDELHSRVQIIVNDIELLSKQGYKEDKKKKKYR